MTYQEANQLKINNLHLLKTVDAKGFTIDEIIIVPTNESSRHEFFKDYLFSNDPDIALSRFINDDLEVWAIDTRHLRESNVLFYNKIEKSNVTLG